MRQINKTGVAWIVVLAGVLFFTTLLLKGKVGELTFVGGLGLTTLSAFVVFFADRLQELNLKELKLVLQELKKTKAEIEEMYGGIDSLKREPFHLSSEKMQDLGLRPGSWILGAAVMRYVAGCMKRERERLAQIFINEKTPESLASALVDKSKDELVFKWNGPETGLEVPPTSLEEREKARAALTEEQRVKRQYPE